MTSRYRFRAIAVAVVTEPPFVPRPLWPRTMADAAMARVPELVGRLLDRLDITGLVIEHISVARIVEAIDFEAVLNSLNLSELAKKVVDDIDLPEMIRSSTGALASDTVVDVRRQTAHADDAVDRLVHRFTPRPSTPVEQ
jgi:hypothetical protein